MTPISDLLVTLGFMTRLTPPRIASESQMRRMLRWIPTTGLVLGFVVALPFELGLFQGKPWIQAWSMVLLLVWLTRGLHYDGIADVCDAFTAHFDPQRFWEVIKDSRCGAFGVMALVMIIGGQIVLLAEMLKHLTPFALLWPVLAGRLNCVAFCLPGSRYARPGLGSLSYAGAGVLVLVVNAILCIATGLAVVPPSAILLSLIFMIITIIPLLRLAKKVDGCNGDFLGASILLGEVAGLLGIVAVL